MFLLQRLHSRIFSHYRKKLKKEEEEEEGIFCNTFVLKLAGLYLMTITMQSQEDKGKREEGGKKEVKQAPVSQLAGVRGPFSNTL